MHILRFKDHETLSQKLASILDARIRETLTTKKSCVLGFASGSSPARTYELLIDRLADPSLNLSALITFNLDEYHPIKQSHPKSYFQETYRMFWRPLTEKNPSFDLTNGHIMNGESQNPGLECRIYEKMIQSVGGIDIQILGLGANGHIGFNEPGTPQDSRTRLIELTESTREANKRFFDNDISKVPTHAMTLGIQSILEAREICLIVTGEAKQPIWNTLKTLTVPTEDIPASFLLDHPNTTCFADL